MIDRILIANRGEIACRVIRTAHALGMTAVAVHSAIDAQARHVREADLAVDLGGERAADSYLRIDALIEAARQTGAQAVHPGYGFLSENAEFARRLDAAGLIFIGPPAAAIDAMGSKSAAKALMVDAGVPLVPGYHGEDQSLAAFQNAVSAMGYPVLLKASAGGGGKGMKVVESDAGLAEAFESARREARSAFGDDRLLVEKYLVGPRHVEVQVFADRHGHCLYLHERDCSIQRRHQKVVEEAPAPGLSPELRRAMGEAAVRAALAIGYVGAGTVEFLLDASGAFYFMEMNTRLQVEHPVTEAITGLDLVAWQIRVAQGEPLPITQAQVARHGHAIEVRLYAEDPDQDFLPSTGRLALYREPAAGPGRRVDSGVSEGDEVSPFYDPMLAKLIAWGEDRETARQRLIAMLDETAVGGVRSNLGLLRRILAHPAFAAAELDTGFIGRYPEVVSSGVNLLAEDSFWGVAAAGWQLTEPTATRQDDPASPWQRRDNWRLGPQPVDTRLFSARGLDVQAAPRQGVVLRDDQLHWQAGGVTQRTPVARRGNTLFLRWQGEWQAVHDEQPLTRYNSAAALHDHGLQAPMNGSVVRVPVALGQQVEAGAALVVMEAMKMEHSIRAPHAGTVTGLYCGEGDRVDEGVVLVELEACE